MITQLTVIELDDWLKTDKQPPQLLDVREGWELETCSLPGFKHIPMSIVPLRLNELKPDQDIVVMCHHGVRSYQICMVLQEKGFAKIFNLQGGINAWADLIDPEMVTY
jgi:rhodanese-related sulfurtransferase